LTVENCIIRSLGLTGILFTPTASSSLAASNTQVANNASEGIFVFPSGSGDVTAMFTRVELINNATHAIRVNGVSSTGRSMPAWECRRRQRRRGRFAVATAGRAPTTLMVFHSVAANNNVGVTAQGTGATLNLAQSMVAGNTHGWSVTNNGVLQSYGDNYIDGNGSNTESLTPVPTANPKQLTDAGESVDS
jgi:hypothetical protein